MLVFHARMDYPKPAGYNPGMQVRCNGVELGGDRLLGRPLRWADPKGRINMTTAHTSFNVHYAPDFTAADQSFYAIPGCKSGEFQLRVGDLLRDGENEVVIANVAPPAVKAPLAIDDGTLRFTSAMAEHAPREGRQAHGTAARLPAGRDEDRIRGSGATRGGLEVTVAGETFRVSSQFSTPAGRWEHGSNRFFRHIRAASSVATRRSWSTTPSRTLPTRTCR